MNEQQEAPVSVAQLLEQLREREVPEENYSEYLRSFLDFKARKQGIPLNGKFELTPLCNLDCKMCYVHLNKEQMGSTALMPKESWMRIMDEAAQMGMMEALFTGGECLTYPDFDALYLHAQSLGVETVIYTNGLLLTKERIDFLKLHPPKDIQISLYGSNDDCYEKVTGKRCFNTVTENIKAAVAAMLPVRIAITPSTFMIDDAENVIRLAHSFGVHFTVNCSLFDPRENTGRKGQKMEIPVDDYVRLYRLQWQLTGRSFFSYDPAELPDFGGGEVGSGRGLYCGGGRSSFSVGYDGKMYICGMLRDNVAYPLETGFSQAWEEINRAAREYPVPKDCVGCKYRASCPTCVVDQLPGGVVNPAICARTRRMAQEGLISLGQ